MEYHEISSGMRMKKIIIVFGVITLASGLFLTFFSLAVVPIKHYWDVTSMWVSGGESRSTALYYKPKPTSNITLDIAIMLYNKTGTITIRVRGAEVDKNITLVNWTGCRFNLPPEPSLIGYVDNNTPEHIRVYFIMSYDAKETNHALTYAGLFVASLGVIELGVSFIKPSAKHSKTKGVAKTEGKLEKNK